MVPGELCRERIVDARAAASGLTIDGDRNANARAAYRNSALGVPGCDGARKSGSIFRIIHAFGSVGAKIAHLVTLIPKPRGKLVLEDITSMVGGKSDAHGR
jgi:hypothetical protein